MMNDLIHLKGTVEDVPHARGTVVCVGVKHLPVNQAELGPPTGIKVFI